MDNNEHKIDRELLDENLELKKTIERMKKLLLIYREHYPFSYYEKEMEELTGIGPND